MPKRTTVVLEREHEKAVKRVMEERNCSQNKAIGVLLDRGASAATQQQLLELVQLKTYFYLRQIAKERGAEFVNTIEQDFSEVRDDMLIALREGYPHVGK